MIQAVSFKGNFLTGLFTPQQPYREKISEITTYSSGYKFTKKVNLVKEYENPNAGKILKQIQKLKTDNPADREEYLRLNKELGPYRIIDMDFEKNLKRMYKEWEVKSKNTFFRNKIKKLVNLIKDKLR